MKNFVIGTYDSFGGELKLCKVSAETAVDAILSVIETDGNTVDPSIERTVEALTDYCFNSDMPLSIIEV